MLPLKPDNLVTLGVEIEELLYVNIINGNVHKSMIETRVDSGMYATPHRM